MRIAADQLELLAAVHEAGSVSLGASELGKTQPSVSRTIKLLEQRLGAPLFVPGRRPLQPTELCDALAAHGRAIAQSGRAANQTLAEFRQGRTGVVRIGGTPFFMDGVVAQRTAEFQKQHPNVRIHQHYAYAQELELRLHNGAIDLAICPRRAGDVPAGLAFRTLLKGRNVIACRAGHPLTATRPIRFADIAAYPWVSPPAGSPLQSDLDAILKAIGLDDAIVSATGGSLGSVLSMTLASDALTVLPVSVVFCMRGQFALGVLNIRLDHPERNLGILTRTDAAPSPAVSRCMAYLDASISSLAQTIEHFERTAAWRA